MTIEQIKADIQKQTGIGFSLEEIRANLYTKGISKEDVELALKQTSLQQPPASGAFILMALLLICIGLLYGFTLRPVFGGLSFRFSSTGDIVRWRELFFQPFGALFLIILGVILIVKKRAPGSKALKRIAIAWFSLLTFMSAFSNNILNTAAGIIALIIIIRVTKIDK